MRLTLTRSTRWHAAVSVIGSESITKPGLTPVPSTATFAFFAHLSIFAAYRTFVYVGYASSSVVDTTASFASSTASSCGITAFIDEVVQRTTTSAFIFLMRDASRGMSYEWMQEFAGQATGLATTFRPTIVGFAAVLDNLSAYVDNVQRPSAVAAASGVYVLAWIFVSGGIISRYAHDNRRFVP